MNESRIYMIHDEEAACLRCDNYLGDEIEYNKNCGPEHAWNRYQRIEGDWKQKIMSRFTQVS